MSYRPQSIRDTTLPVYLDNTRSQHNGLGWADFKQRLELNVPKTRIAQDFGMSRASIWAWVNLYEEQKHADSKTS